MSRITRLPQPSKKKRKKYTPRYRAGGFNESTVEATTTPTVVPPKRVVVATGDPFRSFKTWIT
jgi:hypothetical protein